MPIEFRCSQCDKLLRVGDHAAGRHARCPECGTSTVVPTPESSGQPPAEPFATGLPPPEPSAGGPFAPESPAADTWSGGQPAGGLHPPGPEDSDNPYRAPSEYAGRLYGPPTPPTVDQQAGNDLRAVASFVLGLSSAVFWCIPIFGLPLGIVGLVLGIVALKSRSPGMAVTGIVLSGIGAVLAALVGVLWGVAVAGPAPWMR